MKYLFLALMSIIVLSCNSTNTTDKYVGKWNVYSLIDSKNEIGGGKTFRNSIKSSTPVEDLDFEIEKVKDQYILSGFIGSQVPITKIDENTLTESTGKGKLKIEYNNETQHLILHINNSTVEYNKENK